MDLIWESIESEIVLDEFEKRCTQDRSRVKLDLIPNDTVLK